jgi:hypothetical protein
MRNLASTEVIDTPTGTSRRSLFRKALAAAAAVAGAGALLDFSKRTARAANGDFLTVGNTDPALLRGPDTSSNTTQLDKDILNAEPTLVLTNQNGTGFVSTGTDFGTVAQGATVGSLGRSGNWGVEGDGGTAGVVGVGTAVGSIGVAGRSDSADGTGVRGDGATFGVVGLGLQTGVVGFSPNLGSIGVHGEASDVGVRGIGGSPTIGGQNYGVEGQGNIGVVGRTTYPPDGIGVYCDGRFVATGAKNAAVPHPDGSHRLLYCMESPESWFEDFGNGTLAGGRASVALDPDFAAVVHTADYHVFLTPAGDSRGLYVSSKSATGFTVHEQQGGTSSLAFSYRVVARRKDVAAGRLAKFSLPATPSRAAAGSAAKAPGAAAAAKIRDLPLRPSQVSALPPARSGRR